MQEYKPFKEGKVREVYDNGDSLIIVATDRISAFDHILKNRITKKGTILTQMSKFWFDYTSDIVKNHMLSVDVKDMPEFFQNERFDGNSMMCKKLEMLPIECIVRGYITGSGWASYQENGTVCGIKLPEGLVESDKLPEPIYTPSTKAEIGLHDENISFEESVKVLEDIYPEKGRSYAEQIRDYTIALYKKCAEYARSKGIIIADTKFEFGLDENGDVVIGDEMLTPDSSRFWPLEGYKPGKGQPSFDKQFVRDWLKANPDNDYLLPEEVIAKTIDKYEEAFELLTEKKNNKSNVSTDGESGLNEECGVFGMYDFDGGDVASAIYYGLFALQHRGQESCGIAVGDTDGPQRKVDTYKGMGLVNEVFTEKQIEAMHGDIGVGHVRYATAATATRENAQPLVLNYVKGTLALACNGTLTNGEELRKDLEYTGAIFQTTVESEVIAYHIARERLNSKGVEEAVLRACQKLRGAYALVVMSPRKLIAARDPFGLKPLCIGKRDNSYIIASESAALDTVDAELVRDVLPGEVVTITPENGIQSDMTMAIPKEKQGRCVFEYIYFARPDSHIDGVSVYASRIKAGRFLAKDCPVEADLVVGVPESGNAAALGYALESGIPYGTAFVKNSYVGRTFIKPKQSSRESSVRVKLNVLKEAVKGKRIVMVDDSIVRGTTSDRIVNMLRDAGATEVHVMISSPPFLWPCYFGTDVPAREHLIAYEHSIEDIRKIIGADTLGYLDIGRLEDTVDGLPICKGCFNGVYPMEVPGECAEKDGEAVSV